MRLPDVIGIGPPRTGSTWLYNALRDSVDMPAGVKDTHFFEHFDRQGHRLVRADTFATRPATEKSLRSVPAYFFRPQARERIKTAHSELQNCRDHARSRRSNVFRVQAPASLRRSGKRHARPGNRSLAQSRRRATVTRRSSNRGSRASAARTYWSRFTTNCARSHRRISIASATSWASRESRSRPVPTLAAI